MRSAEKAEFRSEWKQKTVKERADALANWDKPSHAAERFVMTSTLDAPLSVSHEWLVELMSELGELNR